MEIRLAKGKDLKNIAELYFKIFNEVAPDENWSQKQSLNLFRYWIKKQPDMFFVAEENNNIIGGMVANIKPWSDGNRVQDGEIFVAQESQKKSVGTKLFITLLEKAIDKYDVKTFEGITFAGDNFPTSWYKKIGLNQNKDLQLLEGGCKEILKRLKS
jgi:N-acetylglutamate synthase-like GNAT family acetyltransferase